MDVMFTTVRFKTKSSLFVNKLKRLQYFPYGPEQDNIILEQNFTWKYVRILEISIWDHEAFRVNAGLFCLSSYLSSFLVKFNNMDLDLFSLFTLYDT